MDPRKCRVFPAGNRAIAERALDILKAASQKGVLAIVDADLDHLSGVSPSDPDLLTTHTRDAEGILLQSQALKNVLIEFDIDDVFGPTPEISVIAAAASIGYVKFIANRQKWTVRVSQLDFTEFIDPSTLRCDAKSLCKHMADLTITAGITAKLYEAELELLLAAGFDPFKVARGHDATSLLAWAIPIVAGKKKRYGATITGQIVESYLRTAYPEDAFASSELYRKIDDWENRNHPYKVLRR